MVTPEMILMRLPPYLDEWALIKETQYVPDIITEICTAHKLYGEYYDLFCDMFFDPDPLVVADNLYEFCKKYIRYKEESKERQTSALPTGILVRGQGDCKHYSLFCAGVIGSLNRCYGRYIEGWFYFAGYGGAEEPYHVYVSLQDSANEIWLDPTPGSGSTPTILVVKPV